ncbi:cyclase family protein [Streptomyces sp. NPDC053048]|uniref:cyclase family protein n=1 Tax=Streptomyces sp. NPDC053048 TaxID=3365694 RepID=UPI0037D5CC1C
MIVTGKDDGVDDGGQWRAEFDAEVTFANGGSLRVEAFRLDVPAASVEDQELGELFIRRLGLLMVESVRIQRKRLLREPHKGTPGTGTPGRAGRRRTVDLSHVIRDGMTTYPGLPGPEISEHISRPASRAHYAPGTEFTIGKITMVSNTGTYLDSPFHRYPDGPDLAGLDLTRLTDLEGTVIRVLGTHNPAIDREMLLPHDVTGRAVLIHTGWDQHWATDHYAGGHHPYLTTRAAQWLADNKPALVGIDSLNIDNTRDGTRPAHTLLLAAGIPVIEHLRGLEQLPPHNFRFHAAPPAIHNMGTFPVRAYAIINTD